MNTLLRPAVLMLVASLTTACAAAPASKPTGTIDVYRSLERKQCEPGGETLESLRQRLQRAGLRPTAASCGTDGMMRMAMCGAGTGDIGIFTLRKDEAERAAKLGFRPLTDLRDAERTACPGEPPKDLKK